MHGILTLYGNCLSCSLKIGAYAPLKSVYATFNDKWPSETLSNKKKIPFKIHSILKRRMDSLYIS